MMIPLRRSLLGLVHLPFKKPLKPLPRPPHNITSPLARLSIFPFRSYSSPSDPQPVEPKPSSKPSAHTPEPRNEPAKPTKRENIYTIPNMVTMTRIMLCPVLSYTIATDQHVASSVVLGYCAASDWLDGKLARAFPDRMGSVLGSILDPAADKILMTTLVISLSSKSLLPLPLALLIIGRDLLLSISAFYFRYQSLPCPKTFGRFWDFSLPSAQVRPTLISKYNTFLQLILVGLTTVHPILPVDASTPLVVLQWVVATTTISSGLSYIFSKNAIRYLRA